MPQRIPDGRFTLPVLMARETSSSPIFRAASACGSSWIRTAYFWLPYTATCATPSTVESRWLMRVWPYSSSVESGREAEVRAKNSTGDCDGSTLE